MHISSFLDKFKKIEDPKKDLRHVAEILSSVVGADMRESIKQLKNGVVFLNNTEYRTEIFLKKEIFLNKLKEHLPHLHITDVR